MTVVIICKNIYSKVVMMRSTDSSTTRHDCSNSSHGNISEAMTVVTTASFCLGFLQHLVRLFGRRLLWMRQLGLACPRIQAWSLSSCGLPFAQFALCCGAIGHVISNFECFMFCNFALKESGICRAHVSRMSSHRDSALPGIPASQRHQSGRGAPRKSGSILASRPRPSCGGRMG